MPSQFFADAAAFAARDDGAGADEIGGSGQFLRAGVGHGGVDGDAVLQERGAGLCGVERWRRTARGREIRRKRAAFSDGTGWRCL